MRAKRLSLGMIWLVLAQIMVALNIVVSKSLLFVIPSLVLMTIRFGIATLLLFPLHLLSSQRHVPLKFYLASLSNRDWLFIFAQAMCAGCLFNYLILSGLSLTDANVAGIITTALPAMICFFSWLFLQEKMTVKTSMCIVLATLGLLVIAFNKVTVIGNNHSLLGDILVFLSLIPEATYYILTRIYQPKLPIYLTAFLINLFNTLLLIPIAVAQYGNFTTLVSGHWLILIILGVSAGFFYVFWLFGCQKVDGVLASLSTGIMPIATILIAYWLLDDGINVYEAFGLVLVLTSIIIYGRKH